MFSPRSKHIAWPLFYFYFFFCALIGVMMPYFSLHMQSIGLSGAEIGQIFSLLTLSSIFVPHFWGWLAVKLGLPRVTLQLAIIGAFIAIVPFNFISSFTWLWWSMLLFALFYSSLMPLTDSLSLRSIRNLNVPYTRIRVGGSIGYIVAVTLAGMIIEAFGTFVIVPIMTGFTLLALVTSFYVYEQPIDKIKTTTKGNFFNLIKDKEILFFLLLAFLAFLSHAPFNVFFAVHLLSFDYSGDQIGLLIALGVLIEIVVFFFIGNRIGQFNVLYVLLCCFLCGVVRWFFVAWYADNLFVVILTQLMHCITFAVFHLVSIEQIGRLFPERYASQGQAMYSGIGIGLGGGFGMVLAGFSWDIFGGAWTFSGAAGVSVLALVALALSQKRWD
ncbi:MFS transporter [Marinomonas agarivorans]|nr:MFS transporter [Marinomonas agarivorans]